MPPRSAEFGRLLKAGINSIANCEGTTAPAIEDAIGQQIGLTGYSIQRYKAGHIPPENRTIELLAELCVQRGFMARRWVEHFLRAAQYPQTAALLEKFYPGSTAGPLPANLPAPAYSHFVMRARAYQQVLEGLRQRGPAVVLTSLGGMGKTSLAREVAAHCLERQPGLPEFGAIVWASDKDRPGTLNLSVVLDEIARTLDYPGLVHDAFDEKRQGVEQQMRTVKMLLVIDNYETITDASLASWLLRLPEPHKAIITTRKTPSEFRAAWQVELDGMNAAECNELIAGRLNALGLGHMVADKAHAALLVEATGGNPKALELALGLVKYEHRSIQEICADLAAARGTLFDDLFARSWALLDDAARRVFLALPFCPDGAEPAALAAIAGVSKEPFTRATALLDDLALLDGRATDLGSTLRFTQHPLVRAFARSRLDEMPGFAEAARVRWLQWYCELAMKVGFCWNDLSQLDRLDPEHANLYEAIAWAFQNKYYPEAINLIEGVRYYYNVRGIWDERLNINRMRAEAARALGDHANEALGLAFDVEILSKQGRLDEAQPLRARLSELADEPGFSGDVHFEIGHAQALHARAANDLPRAEAIWREMLPITATLAAQKSIVNRRWLAIARYEQGDVPGALALFHDSLADARKHNDMRSVLGNTLKIASIALEQGDLAGAAAALDECRAGAEQLRDRRRLSELNRLLARLYHTQGNSAAASAALNQAIDLFRRMGMRRDLAAAERELGALDAGGKSLEKGS